MQQRKKPVKLFDVKYDMINRHILRIYKDTAAL